MMNKLDNDFVPVMLQSQTSNYVDIRRRSRSILNKIITPLYCCGNVWQKRKEIKRKERNIK